MQGIRMFILYGLEPMGYKDLLGVFSVIDRRIPTKDVLEM